MRRLRLEIAYDGTDFSGWQVQPGKTTIQGILQEVIGGIEGKPVHVAASGRTDAGVHALAQVVAVTLENRIPADNLKHAVNRRLPPTIRISHAREAALEFHPRFDARRKTYEYRIYRAGTCPPFESRYVHHHPYPLNEQAMMEVAPLLEGEHDFTAFAAHDDQDGLGRSKVRTIFFSSIARVGDLLVYRVTGSGFLKHMVRNMVGVLIETGKGNLGPGEMRARLQPNCGIRPGPSVPANGLFLVSVEYGEER